MHRLYMVFDRLFDLIYYICVFAVLAVRVLNLGISAATIRAVGMMVVVAFVYWLIVRIVVGAFLKMQMTPKGNELQPVQTLAVVIVVVGLAFVQLVLSTRAGFLPVSMSGAMQILPRIRTFVSCAGTEYVFVLFAMTIPTISCQWKRGYVRLGLWVLGADICYLSAFFSGNTAIAYKCSVALAVILVVYLPIVMYAYLRKEKFGLLDHSTMGQKKTKSKKKKKRSGFSGSFPSLSFPKRKKGNKRKNDKTSQANSDADQTQEADDVPKEENVFMDQFYDTVDNLKKKLGIKNDEEEKKSSQSDVNSNEVLSPGYKRNAEDTPVVPRQTAQETKDPSVDAISRKLAENASAEEAWMKYHMDQQDK